MFRHLSDRPGTVSTCPNCNQAFRTADSLHAPLILNCRHLCCEDCIRTTFCTKRQIICAECGKASTAKTSMDVKMSNLRDSFPLSERMVEEISKLTQVKPVDESSIGFKSSKRRSNDKPSPNTSLHEGACDECHNVLAILKCLNCNGTLFCRNCWHEVHRFNTNQKHEYEWIASNSQNQLEKNPEHIKKLREYREKLIMKQEKIERCLTILSNRNLIEEAKTSGINLQKVGDDLKHFFLFCQNTIKILENKVMNKFQAIALSLENSQTKCVKDLNHWHMEIVELIRELYTLSNADYFDSSDVEKLLAKSQDLLDKPDTVHTKRPVAGSKKIEMPSNDWAEMLENQLNFDFGQPGEIFLTKNSLNLYEADYASSAYNALPAFARSPSDIGDAFERASHSSLALSDRPVYQQSQRRPSKTYSVQLPLRSDDVDSVRGNLRCESVSNVPRNNRIYLETCPNKQISGPSFSCCGMGGTPRSYYDPKTPGLRANFGRQVRFREGWTGQVLISYISSPSYFYVQLVTCLPTLEKYRLFFSQANTRAPIEKNDIKIGNMYLAQCSDGEWYRVRLSQIVPNEQSVMVNQIDTGRKELVNESKLRRIDDVMKSAAMDPELAIQCCIYDCYPVGLTWKKEDDELFTDTIKDKQINMIVKKVQSNKLEVDLEFFANGIKTSVRDYMLMSKRACIALRKDNQNAVTTPESLKYFRDKEFPLKISIDVDVTYIYGPDEFYVKKHDPGSVKRFESMNEEIDAFYKNNLNYKSYAVATPTVGLSIAAQFTTDNKWYRAEIISVNPQSKKVFVQYVDFGNKETVPFARIRLLDKEFIRYTVQAVRCSMIGIKPVCGFKYIIGATNFLVSSVENRLLKMVVDKVEENKLSVILYRSDDDEDVCLNLLLVDKGFAERFGDTLGSVSTYPRRSTIPDSNPENIAQKQISIKTQEKSENVETQSNSDGSSEKAEETDSRISFRDELNTEDDVDETDQQSPRYEVKIASFISPNLFYVSLINHVTNIQGLINNMTKFYRDEKNSNELKIECVKNEMKCAAYSNVDKKWYRAKVIEVAENDEVTIFFKDIGREETLKSENLRMLKPEFNKLVDGAVACHMTNIEERSTWPEHLCNSLTTALNSFNSIYVTKMPKEDNKSSQPVELWGKNVICDRAFDPTTEEWTNVNNLLSQALQNDDVFEFQSVTSKELVSEPEEGSLKNLEKQVGQVNPTDTVKKWLHSSVVDANEKGVGYSHIVANGEIPVERLYHVKSPISSPLAWNKDIVVDENVDNFVEEPMQDWKPAEPIDLEEYEVWPTYIDDDFNIYVQSLGKQCKLIDVITKGLQYKFENTTPLPMDLHWYEGQICIAWFCLDNKWYRGKVLKTRKNEKTYEMEAFVEYVDFGNTEWIPFTNMRKDVILLHFPIQCHKIPIRSDCVPTSSDGKWPEKFLDFLHLNTLERKCRIKLKKEKGENFYRIERLFVENTHELFDFICQLGYAKFVTSTTAKYSKSGKDKKFDTSSNGKKTIDSNENNDSEKEEGNDEDIHGSDSSSSIAVVDSVSNLDLSEYLEVPGMSNMIHDPFSIPQNPQDNEIMIPYFQVPIHDLNIVTVEVIEILQLNEIVVHIVDSENEAVNVNRKRFLEMNSELQKKGVDQPLLTSPSLGRMCCTKFNDNLWYRAKIIDHCAENDLVKILYVDYGNTSRTNPNSLHEMKRSWFDVPIQSIRCQLLDFTEPDEGNERDVEEMVKLINNKYEAVLQVGDDPHSYKIKLYFE